MPPNVHHCDIKVVGLTTSKEKVSRLSTIMLGSLITSTLAFMNRRQ